MKRVPQKHASAESLNPETPIYTLISSPLNRLLPLCYLHRLIGGSFLLTTTKEEEEPSTMSPCSIDTLQHQQQRNYVVGYALTSKKVKSFLRPKLEGLARNKGISFVPIDQNRPLSDQGPFDIVLHKMTGREWRQILEVGPNPRSYSFCFLLRLIGKVGVPRQLVIKSDASSIPDLVAEAGLRLPLVAKPLINDGSAKSHELSLAYDQYSLQKLEPPLVLQEFVNHGGVLFKVFIVGEAIKVVRRFSLPNVTKRDLLSNVGVYRFPRVSRAAASADDVDLDPSVAEFIQRHFHGWLKPQFIVVFRASSLALARKTSQRTLSKTGYGKMPGYEQMFTDFFLSLVQQKR
ncbi:hypothetical protein V6N11_004033 [Hibiscus sabdariffa]|uniref:Inositol-tetrakisphosphate 1-kinase n=1 Tax=Hibiscus sabdariffa TaxID=183260 RepID=A0ABR2SF14_9ROSI